MDQYLFNGQGRLPKHNCELVSSTQDTYDNDLLEADSSLNGTKLLVIDSRKCLLFATSNQDLVHILAINVEHREKLLLLKLNHLQINKKVER